MNHDTSEAHRECEKDSQHATLPHHNTFSVTNFGKANVNVGWFAVCYFNSLKISLARPPSLTRLLDHTMTHHSR